MKFLIVFNVLVILLAGAAAWELGFLDGGGEAVTFSVQKGENFSALAKKLQAAGVVKNERALRWYVNFFRPKSSLKRGEFGLHKNMTIPSLVWALTEGKPMEYKFTVPEGFNLFQVAEALEGQGFCKKADFIAAAKSPELIQAIPTLVAGAEQPKSIEGYIFPETYLLQKVFSAKEIAAIFVSRFRENYKLLAAEMASSPTLQSLKLTPHQSVILASIVEKETGAAQERPLIASIFVNRLRKRMRLQTDPTIIYGLWLDNGSWDGNIRRKDLQANHPYNTYQISGLPPGPISNPGLNAMKAVLHPAESDYLYFVSKNNGTHVFSKEYSEHAKAVRETQINRSSSDGNSWRNLPAEQRAH